MSNQENSKRIVKNTMFLYIRMLLTLVISLYTSRVVLNTLGIEDFGIYNVVGGIIIMVGFLNNSMSSATQRFLSFELGKKDFHQLSRVFSMSVNIHFTLGLIILVLAETIGLWALNTQLNIPYDRISAANWVYQFSVMTFIVSMITVPYHAVIIANEKMNVYAWVSVLEIILKLLIVFMLYWFEFDKLKLYAVLGFVVTLIISLTYVTYTSINFPERKYRFFWDKSLFNTLKNYGGWNLFGSIAGVASGQGINFMLNIFYGPSINAARGIAYQVQGAVNGFVSNFQMAMNPQIIKSFAVKDIKYMHQLIFQGAKFSYFLLFILSLPILLETEMIIQLWLKIVPEYTIIFTQLILINILIDSISGPLITAAQASGKIKLYQSVVGGLLLLIVPISYLFLILDFKPQVTLYISISVSIVALFTRLKIISRLVKLSSIDFIKNVVFQIVLVSIIAIILPLSIQYFLPQNFCRLIIISFTTLISVIFTIYIIGLNLNEQIFIKEKARQFYSIYKNG